MPESQNYEQNSSVLYLLVTACVTLLYLTWKRARNLNIKYPPCYSGWIPWFGCAFEFGKEPLNFIKQVQKDLGSVFTLKVAGKRLTFLMDTEDFHHFFLSPNVSFQEAVKDPVKKITGMSEKNFILNHTKIHDTVKGRLASSRIKPFHKILCGQFQKEISALGLSGKGDLNKLVRSTMYKGVIEHLFGEGVLPTKPEQSFEELEKHFVKFDEDFEYGAQLPPMFIKDWSNSRNWLKKLFHKVTPNIMKTVEGELTLFQTVIQDCEGPCAPEFGLMSLWASLANAIPITFWTLAYLLKNPDIMQKVKHEINSVLGTYKGKDVNIEEGDLKQLPLVKYCMMEAIRLRSPGTITRKVVRPLEVQGHTIPLGDMLMVSPYWAHRNPEKFPDPEKFDPSRWQNSELDKGLFLDGFIAFGGGRYQCPGRWFGLMEIHIYVTLILHMYDIRLSGSVPDRSPLHLVGTQQPDSPCLVTYKALNSDS